MSVVAAMMTAGEVPATLSQCMAECALRRIVDPLVAAPPTGVRIRTRIHVTEAEAAALTAIGTLLGGVFRVELADRARLGQLEREPQVAWRALRKRSITAVSSSRWAGAITRAVEDQYQLGMRGLATHVADLRAAVEVLEARCALRPGQLAPVDASEAGVVGRSRRRKGYNSTAERFAKTRRLATLRARLASAEKALAAGFPSITVGGKRLWRNRNNLDAAKLTEQQWRDRWDAARMVLTSWKTTPDPDPATVTCHHGAAAAIGRRGLGVAIRRRPAGPRSGQRTAAGTPPARPDLHGSTTRRRGSSGPPPCPKACRSTGERSSPAAKTVRAATERLARP